MLAGIGDRFLCVYLPVTFKQVGSLLESGEL